MKVSVELPDTTPLDEVESTFLQEALVATLYHIGKLSEREACEALGMDRRSFEDLLPRFGFSVLGDDPSNLEAELTA